MVELTVYDSTGELVDSSNPGQKSDLVKELSLHSTQLYINPYDSQVLAYFRGKTGEYSRTEQYFAEYINSRTTSPLSDLTDQLPVKLESMGINVVGENQAEEHPIFDLLPGERLNTSDETVSRICDQIHGVNTVIEAPSYELALAVARKACRSNSVIISDKYSEDLLSGYCDVLIHAGDYDSLAISE